MSPNSLIQKAVDDVAVFLSKSASPTEAVVKVAQKYDLNPNYTKRVTEVVNTAISCQHFKTAKDKAADHPIARIEDVMDALYSKKDKTASEFKSENFVDDIPNLDYVRLLSGKSKRAYVEFHKANSKEETRGMSKKGLMDKISIARRDIEKELNETVTKLKNAELARDSYFFQIADVFKKEGAARTSFGEFESQVFSKYGERAIPYLNLLHRTQPRKEKRGEHDPKYFDYDLCKEAELFDKFIVKSAEVLKIEDNLAEQKLAQLEFEAKYAEMVAQLGGVKTSENTSEEGNIKQAVDPVQFLIDRFKEVADKPSTPKLNNPLDNLERKRILQDLILRDEILRMQPPSKVAAAYEQMLRIAPHLAAEKEIVRSYLRQAVQAEGLSHYDASQLVSANSNLIKQQLEGVSK